VFLILKALFLYDVYQYVLGNLYKFR